VIYIAHCLAGVTGTNDLVATAQTLPYTNKLHVPNKCAINCAAIYTIVQILITTSIKWVMFLPEALA